MVIDCVRRKSRRVRPDCFALKWFLPGFRAMSLPFLVTLIRFVYDLFVFIINVCNSMVATAPSLFLLLVQLWY